MNTYEQMRNALIAARTRIVSLRRTVQDHDRAKPTLAEIDAALALPRRQCDVGTPYEQANRMRQFCAKQKRNGIINCGYCPIKHQYQRDCTLAWAQMPYEEEGDADHVS